MDQENIEKILGVLSEFGFSSLNLQIDDFSDKENVIQLGYAPSRIDLLTHMDDLDFEICYNNREQVQLGELTVNFIDFDSLITTKLSAGRAQDIVDVEKLRENKYK